MFGIAAGNPLTVTDADAANQPVIATLAATHGTLTLGSTSGLTFGVGDGVGDRTMTFVGTLAEINNALEGLIFRPDPNYAGPAAIQLTIDDQGNVGPGGGLVDVDVIPITVVPVNDAPVAGADDYVFDNDAPLQVNSPGLLANDSDLEGDPVSVVLLAGPANGTLLLAADGSFTYQPDATFAGIDSFVYAASDGSDLSAPTTVTLTVNATVGPPPVTTTTDPDPPRYHRHERDNDDEDGKGSHRDCRPADRAHHVASRTAETHTTPPTTSRRPPCLDATRYDQYRYGTGVPGVACESAHDPSSPRETVRRSGDSHVERRDLASATIVSQFETSFLFHQLDSFVDDLESQDDFYELVAGTTVFASGALSAGIFLWAARASCFMTMLSTSLPAWAVVDPIPVLDAAALKRRTEKRSASRADKSLADLVDEVQVPVTIQPLDNRFRLNGPAITAVTRDISDDGIGLVCVQPITDTYLRLTLTTPYGREMDVVACVRHCTRDGNVYHVGASILSDWHAHEASSPSQNTVRYT